jgi:tetratricopeptide (TPR) repeat protein
MGGRVRIAEFLLLLGAIVLVCGVQGMRQAGERLGSALDPRGSADFRFGVWSDTTTIVKHFPIFGVGLGAYQDILPRYEQAPWTPVEIRAAHNDYIQFAAEAGLLGVALGVWLGAAAVKLLANSLRTADPAELGLPTALLCGLASLAVHEVCDFSLHTVANAITASVITGLLLRIGYSSVVHLGAKGRKVTIVRFAFAAVFGALATAALAQDSIPYPYNVKAPAAPRSAIEWSLAHPARAEPHMAIARLVAGASPDMAIDQLRAAAWLSPTDPYIRDSLAQTLMEYGLERRAMRQIELSVAMAPRLAQHEYLRWRLIPWLPAPELCAIKAGFLAAVAHGYADAVDNFAGFYAALGREADEACLYDAAARRAINRGSRERYLLGAGDAYAVMREYSHAENDYFEARETDPMSEAPYDALIGKVYIPTGRFDAAGKLIDSAVRSGLEAYPLLCVLGSGAAATGANREAALAFARAVEARPSGSQAIAGLGRAYAALGQYAKSAFWLERAVDARPESCQLRFEFAQAEEGAYNYIGAQRDYEKANRICGNDAIVAARYESFKLKLRAARGGGN